MVPGHFEVRRSILSRFLCETTSHSMVVTPDPNTTSGLKPIVTLVANSFHGPTKQSRAHVRVGFRSIRT